MTSAIDTSKPPEGKAYTSDIRSNFNHAYNEISNLQAQIVQLQADIVTLKARHMVAVSAMTISPPNTNSAEFVLAGIGVQFTPSNGTRLVFSVQGELGNTQNASSSEVQLCYGEGASPVFGTLVSETNGQLVGGPIGMLSSRANDYGPFATEILLTDLVLDSTYWIGVGFRAPTGGNATLSQMSLVAFEVMDPIT